jgi:DNA-binding NtrC family response regulator
LENIIERAVLLSTKGELEIDLPLNNTKKPLTFFDGAPTLDEMDRRYISYVLEQTGGKIGGPGGAVETLGIKRTTLISRMKKLGLR